MRIDPPPEMKQVEIERRPHRELANTIEGRQILKQRQSAKGRPAYARVTTKDFTERPFIAWDGEGANDDDGRHQYILFGNSLGDEISGRSLGTQDCLDLLWECERDNPTSYHVIFSGKYDVNMILKDCHYMVLDRLHKTGRCKWGGYRIQYAAGKFFRVSKDDVTATLFDVWSFFGTSFVVACEDYLGNDDMLDRIAAGKQRRNAFTYDDLPYIRAYFRAELDYLTKLCQRLRGNLLAADLPISSWHGPGAVASLIFRKQGIKSHMKETPPEVIKVVQHAYAGGRPEAFKGGMHIGKVYQYDRNSAYPAEIAGLPSLSGSRYHYRERPTEMEIDPYGLYHVKGRSPFDPSRDALPHPLYWRGRRGEVYYPFNINGWYWGSEVQLLADYPDSYQDWELIESWHLEPASNTKPFSFVEEMYEQRREWKSAGNPAHFAYKVGLNSMYGKQAQRIGEHHGGPPTWHQLEWAGMVTANNRAAMYRAMRQSGAHTIAVATDAVFSTVPLDLPISKRLGDWEYTESDGMILLQSGVYWLLDGSGEWHAKYRGFNKGSLTVEMAVDYLERLSADPSAERLTAPSTRFMTWSQTRGSSKWRQWTTEDRTLEFGSPLSKRGHYPMACAQCRDGVALTRGFHELHTCGLPWIGMGLSSAHSLPWSEYGIDPAYPETDVLL